MFCAMGLTKKTSAGTAVSMSQCNLVGHTITIDAVQDGDVLLEFPFACRVCFLGSQTTRFCLLSEGNKWMGPQGVSLQKRNALNRQNAFAFEASRSPGPAELQLAL